MGILVTPQVQQALFTNFQRVFEDQFFAASRTAEWKRYCTVFPSATDTESYNWLGTVPKAQQWVDQRKVGSIAGFSYALKNNHYEVTLGVDRDTIADDKFELIMPRIKQLADEMARFPGEAAVLALANGNAVTSLGYDGVPFFSANHTEQASGTQTNLVAATGQTLALLRADLINARLNMRRFKDNQGRPMNLHGDLVVAPPELQDVFEQVINTNMIALASGTQQTNVLQGAFDLIIDPNLSSPTVWYLLDTNSTVKPLIFQDRQSPMFTSLDNPSGDTAFMSREFFYGADSRFAVGYGQWALAVRVG